MFGSSLFPLPSDSIELGASLAVGAPGHTVGDVPRAGAVTILPNRFAAGLVTEGSQLWTLESPGVVGRASINERFGSRLG
jgi:hypothetical protein